MTFLRGKKGNKTQIFFDGGMIMQKRINNSKKRFLEENNHSSFIKHWHIITIALMIYDIIVINMSHFCALWFRFDCQFSKIPEEYYTAFLKFAPIYTVFSLVVFWNLRLYKSIWRFASFSELLRTINATLITLIFNSIGITLLFQRMPISYYLFGAMMQFLFVLGIRFSYRFVLLQRKLKNKYNDETNNRYNVMIIGAGAAGQTILREFNKTEEMHAKVCCIIDDNPNKWKRYIEGVPVVGGRDDILTYAEKMKIDQIVFAIPTAEAEDKRDILNICKETGCELKSLPGIYQLVNGEVTVGSMKDVSIEDLLGREQIKVNMEEIFEYISEKRILVTGGGGSIGSELCRQIAAHSPKQLIIFDVYENNAYAIEQELKRKYPKLNLVVLIGSVRDSRRVDQIFNEYRPEIVYHAAAHKHVPLMETSPCEAIKNNAIGTYKVAYAAMKYNTDRFVLISTDKAVNPTNIMGASKRLCEMIIQTFDDAVKHENEALMPLLYTHGVEDEFEGKSDISKVKGHSNTEFVAVRFGNVLGSNGSVIPLFKEQIKNGGPVTVTHPDIIRYFMTIPEAVSLVLQAGTYANGGEIFVLDMGEPVKIDTLARNLIKLSGYKPDEDIDVVYTGLRPGEKLYEEKLMAEEGMRKTRNDLIHIGNPILFDEKNFIDNLEKLMLACYDGKSNIFKMVEEIVPTYHYTPNKKSDVLVGTAN